MLIFAQKSLTNLYTYHESKKLSIYLIRLLQRCIAKCADEC